MNLEVNIQDKKCILIIKIKRKINIYIVLHTLLSVLIFLNKFQSISPYQYVYK